jgi:hypothetical protein
MKIFILTIVNKGCFSFPNSSLGMPIAKLRLVCQQIKQIHLYILKRQAELEGRHSQARAWERDTLTATIFITVDYGIRTIM